MQALFSQFARRIAEGMGTSTAFLMALLLVVGWAIAGPFYGFSTTWQLIINTATTVITFLMVFLIQYAQNRDGKTIQLKLDEVIHALRSAHDEMIDLDRLSDEELARLESTYKRICDHSTARRAQKRSQQPGSSTDRSTAAAHASPPPR